MVWEPGDLHETCCASDVGGQGGTKEGLQKCEQDGRGLVGEMPTDGERA